MAVDATHPGARVNDPTPKNVSSRSNFPALSYWLWNTHRYGDISPIFVMDSVADDSLPLRNESSIRSFNLNAPLMQGINVHKDYFAVPMQAILPLNWDKLFMNPPIGEDVDSWYVNCVFDVVAIFDYLQGFQTELIAAVSAAAVSSGDPDDVVAEPGFLGRFFSLLVTYEYFFSHGGLLNTLGCADLCNFFPKWLDDTSDYFSDTFDQWFDKVVEKLLSDVDRFGFQTLDYSGNDIDNYVVAKDVSLHPGYCSIHRFLEIVRDHPYINTFDFVHTDLTYQDLLDILQSFDMDAFGWPNHDPINLSRILAYQLVCHHFYTNDKVDYVYSAELYRQLVYDNVKAFTSSNVNNPADLTFSLNGLNYRYDSLSGYMLSLALTEPVANNQGFEAAALILSLVFCYRRSLRYGDYFTSSKTRPLAVGDVSVNVNAGSPNYVSVIDITERIQAQRFFNAVNRVRRKLSDYLNDLFGRGPGYDYHDPCYLGATTDIFSDQEIENTSSEQFSRSNSTTAVFRGQSNNFAFSFECDCPAVVIGLQYYDIVRAYTTSTDRQFFHVNRYDMFNPFLQYIGDQKVFAAELGVGLLDTEHSFGYQLRHQEYKERTNVAKGGFVSALKSWLFTSDNSGLGYDLRSVNPDYIRSSNYELDRFFAQLQGYSLGTYFHFIVASHNIMDDNHRPMAYAPSIL